MGQYLKNIRRRLGYLRDIGRLDLLQYPHKTTIAKELQKPPVREDFSGSCVFQIVVGGRPTFLNSFGRVAVVGLMYCVDGITSSQVRLASRIDEINNKARAVASTTARAFVV